MTTHRHSQHTKTLIAAFAGKCLLAAVCAVFAVSPSSAKAEKPSAEVMDAAKRYEATAPIVDMLRKTADASIERAPEHQKDKLREVFQALDKKKIRGQVLGLMGEHFTAEELDAMAEFYGSPVGRSISQKFPDYMVEANTVIQRAIMQALIEMGRSNQRTQD